MQAIGKKNPQTLVLPSFPLLNAGDERQAEEQPRPCLD